MNDKWFLALLQRVNIMLCETVLVKNCDDGSVEIETKDELIAKFVVEEVIKAKAEAIKQYKRELLEILPKPYLEMNDGFMVEEDNQVIGFNACLSKVKSIISG